MEKEDIVRKLEGGDRRSIGRVDEVVAQTLDDPSHVGHKLLRTLATGSQPSED
jgi:hypothetical protein